MESAIRAHTTQTCHPVVYRPAPSGNASEPPDRQMQTARLPTIAVRARCGVDTPALPTDVERVGEPARIKRSAAAFCDFTDNRSSEGLSDRDDCPTTSDRP